MGAGRALPFAFGSLRRPDCADTPTGARAHITIATTETSQGERDGRPAWVNDFTALPEIPASGLVLLEANRSTLSRPIRLETDGGHVFYESGADLVQLAAAIARK